MSEMDQFTRSLERENKRLRDENYELRQHVERLHLAFRALNALQESLGTIGPHSDVRALIRKVLAAATSAVDSENGSLLLLDGDSGELVFVEVIGTPYEKLRNYRLPPGEGVAHWSVANRQARLVEDVRREPLFSPLVDQAIGFRTRSLICVPLLDEQQPIGAIEVVNTRSGKPFNEGDLDIMQLVGRLASLALVAAERAAA